MLAIHNFIGGELVPAQSGATMEVFEPATGQVYAQVAASDEADIQSAFTAATTAFAGWSTISNEQRAHGLHRIADAIEARLDEFAEAESQDTGKPLSLARTLDIPRAIANFRFFAAAAVQFSSESHAMAGKAINYTLRQPLGVAGCISPWNLPLYLFSWKVAPALAAGNTVVGKPSELTPRTATLLGEACQAAGLPAGVLNIVHGTGQAAGQALVDHPQLAALSFTGSTSTGRNIAARLAQRFTKLSLEMGGKNPALVFADADLDKAAREVVRGAFSNQGQICLCGSRVLVQDTIYREFRERVLDLTRALTVGDPQLPGTHQGALVSQAHFDKVRACLEQARAEGGTVLCGGPVTVPGRCAQGWFITPVWLEGLPNDSVTNQQEIFGPVASLQAFSSETEALQLANESGYGLACSVWSRDLARCHRMAEAIQCGIVWVNCWMQRDLRTPFGGMKESGLGREGGWEAMRFFTEARNVCVDYSDE
jgi:aminomuconate-semialdehyde/2-hydroxymuconate-6-semialdehyde dehydrogenase